MGEILGLVWNNNLGYNKIAYQSLWLDCNDIKLWKALYKKIKNRILFIYTVR